MKWQYDWAVPAYRLTDGKRLAGEVVRSVGGYWASVPVKTLKEAKKIIEAHERRRARPAKKEAVQ